MKWLTKLMNRLKGLTDAGNRYPLTMLFFIAAAVFVAVSINTDKEYAKQLLTCSVGAFLCASLQAVYERFFKKVRTRLALMGCGLIITLGYYLILNSSPVLSPETRIRTWVTLSALFPAFIWVPVIRSRISFNESFMAAFKAFFHSAFYSAVLYGGCSLLILAFDTLIVNVDDHAYLHTANIIFLIFAPLFFLSLIPVYPGRMNRDLESDKILEQGEIIKKAASCPKFLEILISYIIIPITSVLTAILLLYIVRNIRGEFWTNNLMEPMLVSYAVSVILLYILSSRLDNKSAVLFRRIIPKILVPIVIFQITSSFISQIETGITHTRYFVILFGIFAVCAGIAMSLVPVRKNGIIAAMFIVFSAWSVIPPVDAFTVSRISQENRLESVLEKNGMLANDRITPNGSISDQDKKKIVSFTQYLSMMGYTDKITWMPKGFTVYKDFFNTFGFHEFNVPQKANWSVNTFLNPSVPLNIEGYDVLIHTFINSEDNGRSIICNIEKSGKKYTMEKKKTGDYVDIILADNDNHEIISFHTADIITKLRSYAIDKNELSSEEAAFFKENDKINITIVVQDVTMNVSFGKTYYYADIYILVDFK